MSLQPSSDDHPGIRISDADRERAAARLHEAMAEGRITVGELEDRLVVVYSARYETDLRPPLADLPGNEIAAAALSTPDGPPVVLRAGMSSLRRAGSWTVPARLRVQSAIGSVVLDFCETVIPHRVVDIELDLGAGSARVLVPEGATADIDGVVAGMGTVKSKVPSAPVAGQPHFRIHGHTGMGSVTVRRRYRFLGNYF